MLTAKRTSLSQSKRPFTRILVQVASRSEIRRSLSYEKGAAVRKGGNLEENCLPISVLRSIVILSRPSSSRKICSCVLRRRISNNGDAFQDTAR